MRVLAQAALEMGLQRRLVRQQAVERAIQPIVVDRFGRHAEQIAPVDASMLAA
jgi:hypothetical protein